MFLLSCIDSYYKNMYLNIIKFQNGDSQFLEAFAYLYYQDMITSAECLFHTIVACQEIFFLGGGGWISWVILRDNKILSKTHQQVLNYENLPKYRTFSWVKLCQNFPTLK